MILDSPCCWHLLTLAYHLHISKSLARILCVTMDLCMRKPWQRLVWRRSLTCKLSYMPTFYLPTETILSDCPTSYPGYPHGGHYVLPRIKISQKFYQDFGHGLQWLLDQLPSRAWLASIGNRITAYCFMWTSVTINRVISRVSYTIHVLSRLVTGKWISI